MPEFGMNGQFDLDRQHPFLTAANDDDPLNDGAASMPAPYAPNQMQQPLPALYLYPLNDSFLPKHIHLPQGPRVKIGRQTNVKTAPGERNGFFDSKVLSRQHAEVWEENGKVRRPTFFCCALSLRVTSSPQRCMCYGRFTSRT